MISNHIAFYSKIVAKAVAFAAIIGVVGIAVTLITGSIALIQLIHHLQENNIQLAGGHAGIAGAFFFLIVMASNNFLAFLLVISLVFMIGCYLVLAKKYLIQYAIFSIWDGKIEDVLMPKIEQVTQKVIDESYRIDWLTNKTMLKIEFINKFREDPEIKGVKKQILNYVVRKSGLNKIDFLQDKEALPNEICERISNYMKAVVQPSFRFFWLAIFVQVMILIFSQFFYK